MEAAAEADAGDKDGGVPDVEAIAQAHINAVAGACLAIGLKYAGSRNPTAQEVLQHYTLYLLRAKTKAPDPTGGKRILLLRG